MLVISIYACPNHALLNIDTVDIGAGTGPAGPAMAGPFSAKVET